MAKKTKKPCTTGPYVVRPRGYGTAIEGSSGEPIGWCGDNFSSMSGSVPHLENATLFASSSELHCLLAEALASKAIKDEIWISKAREVLSRSNVSRDDFTK
jgi:hypothetical protein